MRVIAGSRRSLKLKTLSGNHTRPTTDRTKETLFNMIGPSVQGCYFLDLFAGSGQIGIEALSRGASFCTFIEQYKPAKSVIIDNLKHTDLTAQSEIICQDVLIGIKVLESKEYDFIFMDPPYNQELERKVLELLMIERSDLITNAIIIVEASLETDFSYLQELGYDMIKEKKYKTNKHVWITRR